MVYRQVCDILILFMNMKRNLNLYTRSEDSGIMA